MFQMVDIHNYFQIQITIENITDLKIDIIKFPKINLLCINRRTSMKQYTKNNLLTNKDILSILP